MEQDFSPILGHQKIIAFLDRLVKLNNQGQAINGSYIFAGLANLGKKTALFYFIQRLLCQKLDSHGQPCGQCSDCQQIKSQVWTDIHFVKRKIEDNKKNISVGQARELIQKLSLSSFSGGYKIGVIYEAETLSLEAANSLLKLLEEPNKKVLIFLLVNNLDDLPLTIASRSQVLFFRPIQTSLIYDYLVKEQGVKRSLAKNLSQLSAGRPGLALDFLQDQTKLDNQIKTAKLILEAIANDINYGMASLQEIISGYKGQALARQALGVIDIWQNIIRDLLLLKHDQSDLVQHQILLKELEAKQAKKSFSQLLDLQAQLSLSKKYLLANVNPKLILENIIINV